MRTEDRWLGVEAIPIGLEPYEIEHFFRLTDEEWEDVTGRRGVLVQLGLSLQIGFLRLSGRLLNSAEPIPRPVLAFVAEPLQVNVPDLASLRSLYRREATLHAHQREAMRLLGMGRPTDATFGRLAAHLRREAVAAFEADELMASAMRWMVRNGYVLPGRRRLDDACRSAIAHRQEEVAEAIRLAVPELDSEDWTEALTATVPGEPITLHEQLRRVPPGRSVTALEAQAEKVRILRELGADRLVLPDLPVAVMRRHAARAAERPPRKLARVREPARTIETACYLRCQLLKLSDQTARMADHRIAEAWGKAHAEAREGEAPLLDRYRRLVDELEAARAAPSTSDEELGRLTRQLLTAFAHAAVGNRTARARRALAGRHRLLSRIVRAVRKMDLAHDGDPLLAAVLQHGQERTDRSAYELLGGAGRIWREAVDPSEPGSAKATAAAASAVVLKRALRNGRLAIPHSVDHAPPVDRLVPERLWLRDRARLVRGLGLPDTASAFLRRLGAQLEAGLTGLDEAVRSGELVLRDGRLVTPRTLASTEPPVVAETRRALFARVGDAQLPDVLVEVDAATRFSWSLLGRPPRTEGELVTLYAALIALGSDLSPTAVCRMVSGVEPKPVGVMVRRLTADAELRAASDDVCSWLRSHPISAGWGDGATASSDAMSIEASRHLWSTRADPRRRAFAVGSYTHLADWWGVLYDQPVVLNARQAGPAIEGALRQDAEPSLSRLAVDTHGHTHFGMGLAKLVGLDLCPRLKDLPSRPLYLPKGTSVPDSLADICSPSVNPRTVQQGWDQLLRLAVSVKDGYCPATWAMERYGSAAKGDRTYEAGAAIGKLLGTVYHADFLTSPDFRREVGRSLARGEAVHTLQRAIHAGPIGPKAGRSQDELAALSNALTLLTNVVMAWNTSRMQGAAVADPTSFPAEHLRRIAPIAHAHVNMRGVMRFRLGEHRDALLGGGVQRTAGQVAG